MNDASPPRSRVLHLVGASGDHGGILSVIRGLAIASADSGWDHVLWVHSRFQQTRQPTLSCRYSPTALDESGSHLRLLWAAWKSWPGLRRLFHADGFQLLHAHSRGALPLAWLARRARLPVLFTNHTHARRRGLYRAAVRQGVPTVLLTPAMARHYQLEDSPGQVAIISACGADRYFETPLTPRLATTDRPLQIVGIGNIVRWKKWDLLAEAVLRLSPELRSRIQVTVWGPVPDDRDARQFHEDLCGTLRSQGLERQMRLAGPTPNVSEILGRADWFVLPSTNEPCSVALIEALASGVPALVSESGGNVDIVADGVTGAWFKPDDAVSLHDCLVGILEGRRGTREAAFLRESVRSRSARRVAAQYVSLYERIMTTSER